METTLDRLLAETVLDTAQRIASLEKAVEQGEDRQEEIRKSIEDLNAKLTPIINKMIKWESKAGAFFFIVGCVWTFFLASWKFILTKLSEIVS